MPVVNGFQQPDSSIAWQDETGQTTLTSAPTPFALEHLARLQSRQQVSAPLADAGGGGAGGAPGLRNPPAQGSYDRPLPPPSVPDVAPSFVDQGAVGAPGGYTPPPSPAAAAPVAPVTEAGGDLVVNPNAGRGGPSGQGGRVGQYRDIGEVARQEQIREETAKGRGGSRLVKGGTFQTGQESKTKMEGGKPDERIAAMSDQMATQAFADQNLRQAQGEHEKYVDDHLGFARFEQEGLDRLHAERKQTALRGLQDERERVEKEVGETKIDPEQFWADKSDGAKIGFILAAAITGWANGRAGIQGNQVLTAVNKRIDDNVSAQIRNLETKKGRVGELGRIYQQAKEQWGDETIARNQAKIAALTAAEKDVRAKAVETGSKVALAGADKIAADLAALREKLWFDNTGKLTTEMDKKYAVTQDRVVGSPGTNWKKVEEISDRGVKANLDEKKGGVQQAEFAGQKYDLGGVSDAEAAKARGVIALANNFEVDGKELERIRQSPTEKLWTSGKQKAIANRMAGALSQAMDQGVLQGNEREEAQQLLTSWRDGDDVAVGMRAFMKRAANQRIIQAGGKPLGPAK